MSKVLAMDPNVELWWIPKCDRDLPENEQFRLKYRNLTAREDASINDGMISSMTKGKRSEYKYRMSSSDLMRCELTIKGWEMFKYPLDHPTLANKDVPFTKENIGLLPQNIRQEYVSFITKRDEIEDDEGEDLGEAKTE